MMRLPFCNDTRFAGYVGNDAVCRFVGADAVPSVALRIVAKSSYKEGGVWKTQDEWATAVFWRKLAEELVAAGIKKGDFIHVEGRRNTRQFRTEATRGKAGTAHEILVERWHQVFVPKDQRADEAPANEVPEEAPSRAVLHGMRDLA